MIITFYGDQYFKLQAGDTVIAVNPPSKDVRGSDKITKFGADIVMTTTSHDRFSGIATVTYGNKDPFTIQGPGNYEVMGNYVQGFLTECEIEKKKYINTAYLFTFDGMQIFFPGMLQNTTLSPEFLEVLENVDILFLPISTDTLSPSDAQKLVRITSPKMIIPMTFTRESLEKFSKENGNDIPPAEEKITLKSKDLAGKEGVLVVLKDQ